MTQGINHIIELKKITKSYNNNVGVFDINIKVNKGEVYGFIGPNGAGKTTTIRQMVGFIKPESGSGTILQHDIWRDTKTIMQEVGYVPGEITLPEHMTGTQYLRTCAQIRKNVDWSYVEQLVNYFDFHLKQRIKKMSKGTKQKVALIAAFMHKPKVLILDEPTSGLDPLMQEKFLKIIRDFKNNDATIFLSSHIFSEIEAVADCFAIIKKGRIVFEAAMSDIKKQMQKVYLIEFINNDDILNFTKLPWKFNVINSNTIKVFIEQTNVDAFLKNLAQFKINSCNEQAPNIQEYFLKFYGDEING